MTVVAYSAKHKIMASDSRSTDDDGMHMTNCRKIFRLKNGALLGTAGDSDDRAVRAVLDKSSPRKLPSREQLAATRTDFEGILVFPKGQVFAVSIQFAIFIEGAEGDWSAMVEPITDGVVAIGSGKQFAYALLDVGMAPVDAVRGACKRDTKCALPVQWEHLTEERGNTDDIDKGAGGSGRSNRATKRQRSVRAGAR